MKGILMNKNTPVADPEPDEDTADIVKVTGVHKLDFLPIGIDNRTGMPNKIKRN